MIASLDARREHPAPRRREHRRLGWRAGDVQPVDRGGDRGRRDRRAGDQDRVARLHEPLRLGRPAAPAGDPARGLARGDRRAAASTAGSPSPARSSTRPNCGCWPSGSSRSTGAQMGAFVNRIGPFLAAVRRGRAADRRLRSRAAAALRGAADPSPAVAGEQRRSASTSSSASPTTRSTDDEEAAAALERLARRPARRRGHRGPVPRPAGRRGPARGARQHRAQRGRAGRARRRRAPTGTRPSTKRAAPSTAAPRSAILDELRACPASSSS